MDNFDLYLAKQKFIWIVINFNGLARAQRARNARNCASNFKMVKITYWVN